MRDEALKLALEALEWMVANDDTNEGDEPIDRLGGQSWNEYNAYWLDGLNNARAAITAIKQARSARQEHEPENEPHVSLASVQEPVAVVGEDKHGPFVDWLGDRSSFYERNPVGTKFYTAPPAAHDLQAELDATNRQVEILSDALAESRREVAALKAAQEPVVFYRCNGCGHAYEQVHPTSCDCMEAGGFERVEYYTTPPAAAVQEGRDWSLLEATQESLREHMSEIKRLKAAQPAVPDAINPKDENPAYAAGWNDCRQAMMEMMK
jgi:rubredoxin